MIDLQPNFRPDKRELELYVQELLALTQSLQLENNDLREKLMILQAKSNE